MGGVSTNRVERHRRRLSDTVLRCAFRSELRGNEEGRVRPEAAAHHFESMELRSRKFSILKSLAQLELPLFICLCSF